ncbi:WxL domain-containing protein [Furfurilactobacillus sp. WILCCON 0119]|uniref:WxL domain-containing protein n=1 Tax=Furfurilactobacillus entadae TaxID=2922307 RepID=UPI0038B3F4BD
MAVMGMSAHADDAELAATHATTPQVTINSASKQLSLVSVPSFAFGKQNSSDVSSAAKTYTAKTVVSQLEVADTRGLGNGWSVSVKASKFSKTKFTWFPLPSNKTYTLDGAVLTFGDPDSGVTGQTITRADSGTTGGAPTASTGSITASGKSADSVKLLSATNGNGIGVWDDHFNNNLITLTVPKGAVKKDLSYTSTLTWTITAAE